VEPTVYDMLVYTGIIVRELRTNQANSTFRVKCEYLKNWTNSEKEISRKLHVAYTARVDDTTDSFKRLHHSLFNFLS
jgi:hypothetical protein